MSAHSRPARGRLAIDREARSLAEAARDARIIVVATPVQAVRAIFSQLGALLPAGALVTDTASTKALVCAWATELLPAGVNFVGGHPMAGKEQSGVQAADPELFQGAIYCLAPGRDASQDAVEAMQALVTTVGARPYYIDPQEHDAYVAGISHLPFLLSAALVEMTSRSPAWKEMAPLAASGFRDVSRLASGDPVMHRDICLTNRAALTRWINDTTAFLAEVREHLEQGDEAAIETLFRHAKQARDEWLATRPNQRPGEDAFAGQPAVERPSLFGLRRGSPRDKRKP
jgi:prephenate dehydrogenase